MRRGKQLKNRLPFIGLFACLLMIVGCEEEKPELPYFGINQAVDGEKHKVPKFAFLNQDSTETSHKDFENHIFVTDFFFTTCPSICPVMTSQMSRLQDMLKQEELWGEVKILSHTVNPEGDRPHVLKAYAEDIGADLTNWHFVTGEQEDLYRQAEMGYYMTALESDTAAGGFFHSDNFVLIDRDMHIRGYYDGTSTKSVNQLLEDIKTLHKHSQND